MQYPISLIHATGIIDGVKIWQSSENFIFKFDEMICYSIVYTGYN